jgi:hypothetical protein
MHVRRQQWLNAVHGSEAAAALATAAAEEAAAAAALSMRRVRQVDDLCELDEGDKVGRLAKVGRRLSRCFLGSWQPAGNLRPVWARLGRQG